MRGRRSAVKRSPVEPRKRKTPRRPPKSVSNRKAPNCRPRALHRGAVRGSTRARASRARGDANPVEARAISAQQGSGDARVASGEHRPARLPTPGTAGAGGANTRGARRQKTWVRKTPNRPAVAPAGGDEHSEAHPTRGEQAPAEQPRAAPQTATVNRPAPEHLSSARVGGRVAENAETSTGDPPRCRAQRRAAPPPRRPPDREQRRGNASKRAEGGTAQRKHGRQPAARETTPSSDRAARQRLPAASRQGPASGQSPRRRGQRHARKLPRRGAAARGPVGRSEEDGDGAIRSAARPGTRNRAGTGAPELLPGRAGERAVPRERGARHGRERAVNAHRARAWRRAGRRSRASQRPSKAEHR